MIVRRLAEIEGTDREVQADNWTSRRLLLRDDGMGFSLHDTVIRAGTSTEIHYQHHLEAVYCIEGDGCVHVVGSGERFAIGPGTLYALDENDEHVLVANTDMRMICVFNPALVGPEIHDENGVYPAISAS